MIPRRQSGTIRQRVPGSRADAGIAYPYGVLNPGPDVRGPRCISGRDVRWLRPRARNPAFRLPVVLWIDESEKAVRV